jgi:hypothetical protein
VSAATLTASWQIETRNEKNETTTQFEAKGFLNITVYPPTSLTTGGVRSLIVYSEKNKNELARYPLGYYSSGNQTSATAKTVSVNFGAFSGLIHGDTLSLQIRDPTDRIEFTTAVSVSQDVEALINSAMSVALGRIADLQRQIDYLAWQVEETARVLTNYILMLGIVIGFIVAYSTRDRWLNRKRKDEETKSTTEFENFLETFVLERYQTGDQKVEEAKADA